MAVELKVNIKVSPRDPREEVQLCIVNAQRWWTALDVMHAVEESTGIHINEQRLFVGARELYHTDSLLTLPTSDAAEIRLTRRSKEQVQWLGRVAERGMALCAANSTIRKDRDVVLAAVARSGRALKFVPDVLRKDREVVMAAVESDGYALRYAAPELHYDREVVLTAVHQNGLSLHFAAEPLRADPEVVQVATGRSAAALQFAAEDLRVTAQGSLQLRSPSTLRRGGARAAREVVDGRWPSCKTWSPTSTLSFNTLRREVASPAPRRRRFCRRIGLHQTAKTVVRATQQQRREAAEQSAAEGSGGRGERAGGPEELDHRHTLHTFEPSMLPPAAGATPVSEPSPPPPVSFAGGRRGGVVLSAGPATTTASPEAHHHHHRRCQLPSVTAGCAK